MKLHIDTSGSAKDEILLELELNPPPEFKRVNHAIEWAEEHLPINTYYEVWGSKNNLMASGHTRTRGGWKRGTHKLYPRPEGRD